MAGFKGSNSSLKKSTKGYSACSLWKTFFPSYLDWATNEIIQKSLVQHLCSDPVPLKGHNSISVRVKEIEEKRKFVSTKILSTEQVQIVALNIDMKSLVRFKH